MCKRRLTAILLLICLVFPCLFCYADDEISIEEIIEEVNLDDPDLMDDELNGIGTDGVSVAQLIDQRVFTPSYGSPYEGRDDTLNYWTLPMDITDEEAVWKVLMQPVTVLNGKMFNGNSEKVQIVLRKEPDPDSDGIGVVTCESQAVHVLERGNEWSLIECYSSSFHDSKVINWNVLVQGWIESKYLKEVVPNQEMGIVVDKLTQRLYLFMDGKLFTTLLVSTGVSNATQPYNETRSGEFLLVSKTGDFKSDNMTCLMAIRFNSGDLLHEVPYVYSRTDAGYKKQESALGTRASHGCIRVQRKKTPEGVNMEWIYKHWKKNTKFLVWEDWQGRQISYPADETPLYYNPGKGQNYHTSETCYSAPKIRFEAFTYGQLDEAEFEKLTRCPFCAAPLRKAEIDQINAEHAAGGDHDPILTEARTGCPMVLKDWQKIQKQLKKKKK